MERLVNSRTARKDEIGEARPIKNRRTPERDRLRRREPRRTDVRRIVTPAGRWLRHH